ncbi:TM2 domain-containing protein [Verrucomicrobiaceae bacterium N1E253]|uniref:TM2 domain-containing protein n=1 Tax=Oceaniferula marina TaxID=2748318 RepID=A0A851GQY0_9BACT|nr:TM2 domain-containing protein [Oceaniferula marina]NWK57525.1 TM2 domain-containing protein [Oceaniferula marina]
MSEEPQEQSQAVEPTAPQSPPPAAPQGPVPGADKKILAGVLGIILGSLGIHKFVLGYQKEGIIMLVISLVSCGFASPVMGIIGLIEGIMYITKSDEEFVNTYITNQKPWF